MSLFPRHRPAQDCHNPFALRYIGAFCRRNVLWIVLLGVAGYMGWSRIHGNSRSWIDVIFNEPGQQAAAAGSNTLETMKVSEPDTETEWDPGVIVIQDVYAPADSEGELIPILFEDPLLVTQTNSWSGQGPRVLALWDDQQKEFAWARKLNPDNLGSTAALYRGEMKTLYLYCMMNLGTEKTIIPYKTAFDYNQQRSGMGIQIIDVYSGELIRRINTNRAFRPIDVSPDGSAILGRSMAMGYWPLLFHPEDETWTDYYIACDVQRFKDDQTLIVRWDNSDYHEFDLEKPELIARPVSYKEGQFAHSRYNPAYELGIEEIYPGNAMGPFGPPDMFGMPVQRSPGDESRYALRHNPSGQYITSTTMTMFFAGPHHLLLQDKETIYVERIDDYLERIDAVIPTGQQMVTPPVYPFGGGGGQDPFAAGAGGPFAPPPGRDPFGGGP